MPPSHSLCTYITGYRHNISHHAPTALQSSFKHSQFSRVVNCSSRVPPASSPLPLTGKYVPRSLRRHRATPGDSHARRRCRLCGPSAPTRGVRPAAPAPAPIAAIVRPSITGPFAQIAAHHQTSMAEPRAPTTHPRDMTQHVMHPHPRDVTGRDAPAPAGRDGGRDAPARTRTRWT